MARVIEGLDAQGMVAILGVYPARTNAWRTRPPSWLLRQYGQLVLAQGYRNVLLESTTSVTCPSTSTTSSRRRVSTS